MRSMLSNISCSTAVLTAQSQTLKHTQCDQDHRSSNTDSGVVRQNTNDKRSTTHDEDRHQEGVLTTNQIA